LSPDENDGDRGFERALREAGPYLGLGTSLAVTVLLCLWGGHWVDRRFHVAPVGFLVGAVIGLVGAGLHFYQISKVMGRKQR
jgi:hypothetical protein